MAEYKLTNKTVEDLSNIWNYTFEVWTEKKRLEQIEKIDISDWKKEHGYE